MLQGNSLYSLQTFKVKLFPAEVQGMYASSWFTTSQWSNILNLTCKEISFLTFSCTKWRAQPKNKRGRISFPYKYKMKCWTINKTRRIDENGALLFLFLPRAASEQEGRAQDRSRDGSGWAESCVSANSAGPKPTCLVWPGMTMLTYPVRQCPHTGRGSRRTEGESYPCAVLRI